MAQLAQPAHLDHLLGAPLHGLELNLPLPASALITGIRTILTILSNLSRLQTLQAAPRTQATGLPPKGLFHLQILDFSRWLRLPSFHVR